MKLPPRVVALSPGDLAPELCDTFAAAARAALDAGLRGLLLREAALEDGAFLALARALAALRDEHDAWFGVHDRAHIARLVGADGLHLGFRSLAPADVPAAWRAGLAVGLSTHAHDHVGVEEGVQGDDDAWRDADYLFHGPVLDTPSKRGLLEPVGFGGLAAAVS
ncbi:MAG: thiamine phosphate synthase, partial [Planctomycetota bacterium]|nr:thiamine phosphate synthase [Planctomycetota bacterium]